MSDLLIELLAIKLFEHDADSMGNTPKTPNMGWTSMDDEDKEIFRHMARAFREPPE